MFSRFRALLSVLLAVSFSLSPALSWYAFADGQEVAYDSEYRGIGRADEPGAVGENSQDDGTTSAGAADATEAQAEVFSEVSPRSDSDSSGSVGSGLDDSSEDSYSSGGRDFKSSVSQSLADIVLILGEIADYYRTGNVGISPLADINSVFDQLVSIKANLGSYFGVGIGSSAASNRINWDFAGVKFNTGKGDISWLVASFFYVVNNRLASIQSDLQHTRSNTSSLVSNSDSVISLLQRQWGFGYGGTAVTYNGSPADLLGKVQRNSDYVTSLYGLIQEQWGYGFGGTVVTEKGSPFDLLGKIQRNSDFITSLDSRVSIANDLLGKIQRNSDYITSLDSRVEIANDLLGKIQRSSDFITSLDSRLERYYPAHSQLVSKGFSDVLDSLGSLSVSVQVDLSGVESRLDSIIRLLTVAGVVENAKDVLDAIFGDMSLDATGAASAAVGSAIQNAFPFCVPAVLKQILGLLQADPAPPEFHFDFWGAPLDFGFSDWQGLADMTSWLSRIGFAVVLFANSRRFVYSGGVAGD